MLFHETGGSAILSRGEAHIQYEVHFKCVWQRMRRMDSASAGCVNWDVNKDHLLVDL